METNLFEPLFLINTAIDRTGLTGRQIRYYEEKGIILPFRKEAGNQRVFSLYDIKILDKIRNYSEDGMSLDTIRERLKKEEPDYFKRVLSIDLDPTDNKPGQIDSLYPVSNVTSLTDIIMQRRKE